MRGHAGHASASQASDEASTGGSSRRTLDPMAWNGGRRIGIVSTRLSGTDGVSLEAAKWEAVLGRLGYDCFYLAGQLDRPPERSRLVPEAFFGHPDVHAINMVAFSGAWDVTAGRRRRAPDDPAAGLLLPVRSPSDRHATSPRPAGPPEGRALRVHPRLRSRPPARGERPGHPAQPPAWAGPRRADRGDRDPGDRPPPRLRLGAAAFRGQLRRRLHRRRLPAWPAIRAPRGHQLGAGAAARLAHGPHLAGHPQRHGLREPTAPAGRVRAGRPRRSRASRPASTWSSSPPGRSSARGSSTRSS